MSVHRNFESLSMAYGNGRVHGVVVRCRCGAKAQHPRGSNRVVNSSEAENNKRHINFFERHGWRIGFRHTDDRCPDCVAAIEREKRNKPALSVVPKPPLGLNFGKRETLMTTTANGTAPPRETLANPREPTREDKRVILAKLEDVYDTPAQRYSQAWTDAKLATDMGVPRAWVEKLRAEFFGSEGSNQEINSTVNEANQILAEAKTLLANTTKAVKDVRAILTGLDAAHQRLSGMMDRTERKIEVIEKAVRP